MGILNIERFMHLDMMLLTWWDVSASAKTGLNPTTDVTSRMPTCLLPCVQSPKHQHNWGPLGLDPFNTLMAPCDDLMATLGMMTFFFSTVAALLHPLYLMASSYSSLSGMARGKSFVEVLASPLVVMGFWWIVNEETNAYGY